MGVESRPEPDGRVMEQGERGRRVVIVAGLIVLAAMTVFSALRTVHTLHRAERNGETLEINDFDRWLQRMPGHLEGHADIVDERSANSVLDMMLLSPFTYMSRVGAHVAWTLCKPLFVIGIVALMMSMVREAGYRLAPVCLLAVFVAWAWPVIGDIQEGQTNLLMLLPLMGGLWAAQRERKAGFIWLSGLLIGLAVAIKVTPLAFFLYALLRRRWVWAAAMLLGMGVWFYVVPGLVLGYGQTVRWEGQWWEVMIVPYARGDVRVMVGESVPSFLTKLLRAVPAFVSHRRGSAVEHYMNVANLSAAEAGWIIRMVLGAAVLGGAWWMRRGLDSLRSGRFIMEAGCVAAFMLWASHWTFVAHYVTLLVPLCAVAILASDETQKMEVRRRAGYALVGVMVLMFLTSDAAKWIAGPDGREYMLAANVCLMASALLVGVIVWASGRRAEMPAAGGIDWVEQCSGKCVVDGEEGAT